MSLEQLIRERYGSNPAYANQLCLEVAYVTRYMFTQHPVASQLIVDRHIPFLFEVIKEHTIEHPEGGYIFDPNFRMHIDDSLYASIFGPTQEIIVKTVDFTHDPVTAEDVFHAIYDDELRCKTLILHKSGDWEDRLMNLYQKALLIEQSNL